MTTIPVRDVALNVKVIGHGYPLALMHGGPGADLYTLMSFKPCADHFTLVFYDHRCNGRSKGAGLSTAQRLAGELPSPHQFDALPWAMRSLPLIPILQIAGVFATLRLLRSWRQDPALQPSRGRMWGQHILLPLISNLLAALMLVPMLGKMRGFVKNFMPDFSWIALVCGSFAGIWAFLRTGLILRALRKAMNP